jgi:hypothetical protein
MAATDEKEYESCSVVVSVRCRPFNEREKLLGAKPCIEFVPGGKSLKIYAGGVPTLQQEKPPGAVHPFTFDNSYSSDISQQQVFEDIGRPVLGASFAGFNTCIFAYGQTGSGKSYAMMGPSGGRDSSKNPGLIPRICTQMFADMAAKIAENEAEVTKAKAEGKPENEIPAALTIEVQLTYLEIYQERVKCLLNPKKENLRVRQHPKLGVFVDGLTHMTVTSFDQVLDFIEGGNSVRHIAATNMNESSSRSHAIFTLILKQSRTLQTKMGEDVSERISRVNLVDLAGSERAKSTGAEGDTLKEGSNINKSLTVLGQVISGLAELNKPGAAKKTPFIPYRDSTLTWLLKENLGGNSKTYMISTLSPADVNYEETLSTLRYADRAKQIVTKACVNEDPRTKLIQDLQAELAEAKRKMALMEERARRAPPTIPSNVPPIPLRKMPQPEVVKVGGPRGGAVTPPGEYSGSEDDVPADEWIQATPRNQGQEDQLRLQTQFTEHLLEEMLQTKAERQKSEALEMEQRREVMEKALSTTVKAQINEAYLMNLEGGGDWVIEYLLDDVTYLAAHPEKMEPVGAGCRIIQIEDHEDIGSPHCCVIKTGAGTFVLRAMVEGGTFVDDSESPIQEDTVLSRGQTIQLGEYVNMKFVDNTAPLPTSRKARMYFKQAVQPGAPSRPAPKGLSATTSSVPRLAGLSSNADGSASPPARVPMLALGGLGKKEPSVQAAQQPPPLHADPMAQTHSSPPKVPALNFGAPRSTSPAAQVPSPSSLPSGQQGSGAPKVPSLNLGSQSRGSSTPRPGVPQLKLAAAPAGGPATPRAPNTARAALGMNQPQRAAPVVRTPRSMGAGSYSLGAVEEMVTVNRHSFVVLGDTNAGKTTLRTVLEKESTSSFPFNLPFGGKKLPEVLPTIGFDSNVIKAGSMSKVDMTFLELSGLDSFATLQLMIPEQRVTFILCWRLNDDSDLRCFKKYIEMIQCRSPTSDTAILLMATCRDLVKYDDYQIQSILQDVQSQLTNFLFALEPDEQRRPRIVNRFAVSNKDKSVVATAKVKKHSELLTWLADHAVTRCKTDLEFPHSLVPGRVVQLERKILELRHESWMIPSAEYKTLARGIDHRYDKNIEELHKHTQLLQAWGALHHAFRHMLMKKQIILDVQWVFKVITTLSCCISTHTAYIKSGEQNHPSPMASMASASTFVRNNVPPFSTSIAAFGGRLPFSINDVIRQDTHGMLAHGVLTFHVAEELFGQLMREKGMTDRRNDVVKILDLLGKYDLIMEGSKIFSRALNNNSIHSLSMANVSAHTGTSHESLDREGEGAGASISSFHGEEQENDFYLIPACFNFPVPPKVPLHLTKLLYGPSLRFSLNTVPTFFFARLVSRISIYAQKLYVGPVTKTARTGGVGLATGREEIVSASFWGNCVWVVSSDISRAFIRMVQKAVFITFHDPIIDFEFREGVATAVQSLIAEFPGVRCEQSEQCFRCEEWIEPAAPEDYYFQEEQSEEMGSEEEADLPPPVFVAPLCPKCQQPRFKSTAEQLEVTFVADEAMATMFKDDFLTDEAQQRFHRCFKHIAKGRGIMAGGQDETRGARIDGAGLDSLLDALATE